MFPWEHVAVAYVGYSLGYRALRRRAPPSRGALALAVGAALPDLIDKPLSWGLAVLPGGRSLGHSLLFALPAIVFVWLLAGRVVGSGFAAGYAFHLPADVYYPVVFGRDPVYSFLLYPLTEAPPSDAASFLSRLNEVSDAYAALLASPRGRTYLAFELLLLGGAALLWLLDGAPGVRPIRALRSGEHSRGG